MDIKQSLIDYFHGFQELSDFKKLKPIEKALTSLKVMSYFTLIIPAGLAVTLGAVSLKDKIQKEFFHKSSEKTNQVFKETVGPNKAPINLSKGPILPTLQQVLYTKKVVNEKVDVSDEVSELSDKSSFYELSDSEDEELDSEENRNTPSISEAFPKKDEVIVLKEVPNQETPPEVSENKYTPFVSKAFGNTPMVQWGSSHLPSFLPSENPKPFSKYTPIEIKFINDRYKHDYQGPVNDMKQPHGMGRVQLTPLIVFVGKFSDGVPLYGEFINQKTMRIDSVVYEDKRNPFSYKQNGIKELRNDEIPKYFS